MKKENKSFSVAVISIFFIGMVSVILLTDIVRAENPSFDPFLAAGGLPQCTSDLNICTTHLSDCEANLALCLVTAPVMKTGQTTIHSYATGDDGDLQMGVEWPDPRFTDNGDGTVTDNLTRLIWMKDANCFGPSNWYVALENCNGLANLSCGLTDGSIDGDWHLPNIRELLSLVDYGALNPPSLPVGHPFVNVRFHTFHDRYWSSTTRGVSAWNIRMFAGDTTHMGFTFPDYSAWCVRQEK